ncbi:LOW QUALITY PROTEIN: hypothetical protein CVT25_006616 [Psilocybe cyanescens]|uniref:cellulase n=1 Tax=Psilocybe cyanescens TaxID=93625 RepID=A0A409XIN1_PSICY|nr:LOW QUALITY PROTEIN: hypothetical protein CVT25_006616 [Psilocybe cyanescens]
MRSCLFTLSSFVILSIISPVLGVTLATTSSAATPTATVPPVASVCPGTRTKFKFFGVNESGAEFNGATIPGLVNTNFVWPRTTSIDFFMSKGFNTFRIPFLMERLNPPATGMTGPFDQNYLNSLKSIVNYITTTKGGFAVIDPHNYMRYINGTVISNVAHPHGNVYWPPQSIYADVMNEPHDIAVQSVFNLNQAAINGIRASGATSQLILVEGTSWTGAWTWVSSGNGAAFSAIKDPNNNVAVQMHQYLDSNGSGTSATCASATVGADRLASATAWLKANNLKGFLGEFAGGANDQCIAALQGALCAMQQSGVWIGATWWGAGPWWNANYIFNIEPPSGVAVAQVLPQALLPFV